MAQVQHDTTGTGRGVRIGRLDVVLVVACLGMLAAVAVPRQQSMTGAAYRAEVNALAGSVRGAAAFGHAQWQARGEPAGLDTARGRVRMVNGYPAAADLDLLLEPSEVMAFRHARGTWRHRASDAGEHCSVRYTPPETSRVEPTVQLQTSGC